MFVFKATNRINGLVTSVSGLASLADGLKQARMYDRRYYDMEILSGDVVVWRPEET